MRRVLNRYGLTRLPFAKELAADELLSFERREESRNRLRAAIEGRSSAVLTGDTGVGKTFLLRALERELSSSRFKVTYIHNSGVTRRDFYRQLAAGLGLEPKASAAGVFRQVQVQIEDLADAQKVHPVLILDEAHLLPVQVLEHLHILLNYRRDSCAFLSLVLIGLPELRDRLARNVLASLSARLPVRVHLDPLVVAEVDAYLRHRMKIAGCTQEVFSEEAVLCIREATGGVLRKVDLLAQTCLEAACEGRGMVVDGKAVHAGVKICGEALR